MAKVNLRAVPCTGSVLGLIEGAYSELEALHDECQEIVDNASDGLSQTQRIQTFEETANTLDFADSVPDVPEVVQDLEVHYTEDRRKSKSTSRATRCSESCNLLYGVVAALDAWLDDDSNSEHEDRDDVESLKDDLENNINEAEGCEFPGMYG